jgi:undecaprenyl-diphosphatase
VFMVVMVSFRLVSGVHWFSDIAGGVLLSTGLYCVYKGAVTVCLSDKYKGRK